MRLIIIEAAMDNKFRDILDSLPAPEPRSCLDPFRELIDELHRRGRTYREISSILAERCEIFVSVSTVYRFLHRRSRFRSQSRKSEFSPVPKMKKGNRRAVTEEKISVVPETETKTDEIQRRISVLKHRHTPDQTKSQLFHYDPDEPLHLPTKPGRNIDQ
jgi:IS30 family transposase